MPRFVNLDGGEHIETSSPAAIVRLRSLGWSEHAARTKAVREDADAEKAQKAR